MTDRVVLLRYHEIALKGGNRRWFEQRLGANARKIVQRALGEQSKIEIEHQFGRIILHSEWNEAVLNALQRVFGLSSYSPIIKTETKIDRIAQTVVQELEKHCAKHGIPKTFRIRSRRSDKALPESSMEIDRHLGSIVLQHYPSLGVELKSADLTIGVEVRFRESFVWTEKISGPGGLPVGSNAPVLTLISGGLDSPVAAIQTIRRGSASSFVHFHGTPFIGDEVLDKVEALVRIVDRYQPDPQPLYIVPFGKIQEKIALVTNPKMRTVLYRRMMIRIAEGLARKINALALVTGESLGQVASQTLENLTTINSVAKVPILRPLISFDKDEIIRLAEKWETFDISIQPTADCCTLFADRHPILRSTEEWVKEQEKKFSVPEMIQEALSEVRTVAY